MHSKNVRLAIFVGACVILLGVIFFKNNAIGDKFAQANALMSRLQSSALYTDTLTDSELALLKTTREESQSRIALLTTTINSDTTRAKGMIAEVALQTAILDNFTLKAPRSYFTNNVDSKLGILSTNTELKTLLDSINKQVNDKNIRESFIVWYDEFFATVCSTTDSANDISIKGTVTFQNGSPESTDTCQGNVLVQTQCVNKQNIGAIQTTCPNGCSDGACIDTPVNTLKGFTITMLDTVNINIATGVTISAVKNDNSIDTTYNKQVIILVDGDPNASFPLTAQTLANGTLTLDSALKFKKVGNVTVTVKDITSGTESSKNITVTDGISGTTTTGTTTGSATTTTGTTTSETTGTTGATTTGTTNSTTGSTTSGSTDSTTTGTTTGTSGTTTTGTTTSTTTGDSTITTSGSTTTSTGAANTGTTTGSTTSGTGQAVVNCPTYTAPPCSDGHIVTGGIDSNGCTGAPTCISCPQYTAPAADFCAGGKLVGGGTNEVGCQVPPTCEPKVTTGTVSIDEAGKDCWFGDMNKRITLGEFLGYQSNPNTNSGLLVNSDSIGLFGSSAPSLNSTLTNLLTYEEVNGTAQWKGDSTVSNSTQLTNFFVFRTTSEGTRTWNIPTNGIKFYGCFTRGDQPTVW